MAQILTVEKTLSGHTAFLNKETRLLNYISPALIIIGILLSLTGVVFHFIPSVEDNSNALIITGLIFGFIGFGQRFKASSNQNDIMKFESGRFGEQYVVDILKNQLPDNYYILNDCVVAGIGAEKAQIDHLVVCETGIFVIETKNYKGKISSSALDANVVQIKMTASGEEKKILSNPVSQNKYHCKVLKDFLRIKSIEIPVDLIKSIVIFAHREVEFNIENLNAVNAIVCRPQQAVDFIRNFTHERRLSSETLQQFLINLGCRI